MTLQGEADQPGNLAEGDFTGRERLDRRLVGRVQHRAAGPAPPCYVVGEAECGEPLEIRRLEAQRERLLQVQPLRKPSARSG